MNGARAGRGGEIPAAAPPTQSPRKTARRRHRGEEGSGAAGWATGMPRTAKPSRSASGHPAGRAAPQRGAQRGQSGAGHWTPGIAALPGTAGTGGRSFWAVVSWCAFVGSLRRGALLPGPEPGGGGKGAGAEGDAALFHWHDSGGGGMSGVRRAAAGERSGRRRGFLIPLCQTKGANSQCKRAWALIFDFFFFSSFRGRSVLCN